MLMVGCWRKWADGFPISGEKVVGFKKCVAGDAGSPEGLAGKPFQVHIPTMSSSLN